MTTLYKPYVASFCRKEWWEKMFSHWWSDPRVNPNTFYDKVIFKFIFNLMIKTEALISKWTFFFISPGVLKKISPHSFGITSNRFPIQTKIRSHHFQHVSKKELRQSANIARKSKWGKVTAIFSDLPVRSSLQAETVYYMRVNGFDGYPAFPHFRDFSRCTRTRAWKQVNSNRNPEPLKHKMHLKRPERENSPCVWSERDWI